MQRLLISRRRLLLRSFSSTGAPKSLAFVFSGQGSQHGGMGKHLASSFRVAQQYLDRADAVLKLPLSKLMFEGTDADVSPTEIAQPAITALSIASFEALKAETGLSASATRCVLGHSVGEIAALYAAGSLAFDDALLLARFRGEIMSKCVGSAPVDMAALMPLAELDAVSLLQEVHKACPGDVVDIANINSPKQIVISGTRSGIRFAIEVAKRSFHVKKAVLLNVSCPFHSRLMRDVERPLNSFLRESISLRPPTADWFSNLDARSVSAPVDIAFALAKSSYSPVRWSACVAAAAGLHPLLFVELGPREVLSPLIRQCDPSLQAVYANSAPAFVRAVSASM